MAFPSSFIEELTSRCDIVETVSPYVELKKNGANYFGLCPFHSEKTPSFSVSEEKQIFYCFGCGAGGSAINFIMRIEGLDYPEAVRHLAKLHNMEVPDGEDPGLRRRRERVFSLNREAALFFHEKLCSEEGRKALDYLKNRSLSARTVKKFGLGYAPSGWNLLINEMTSKGYTKSELLDAGLVVKNSSGGVFDRFKDRIMFPIIDLRGNVLAFGGRVMDDSLPKYLNSPDTMVFTKGRNLFAMNIAKRTKQGRIILAEGYMDVIALHQAGFDMAVASLGTSLTDEQARLISRYGDEAVIAYDSDEAGSKAADRAVLMLKKTGLKVKVLRLTGAKDPDEFIKKYGSEKFKQLLDHSENHIEFKLLNIETGNDLSHDEGRISYLKQAVKILASVESPIEREIYAHRAALKAGVSDEAIKNEIKKELKLILNKKNQKEKRKNLSPVSELQPKAKGIRYGDIKSAVAEEGIIASLMADPSASDYFENIIKPEEFSSEFLGNIYKEILSRIKAAGSVSAAALSGMLTNEQMSHLTGILLKPAESRDIKKAAADYIDIIKMQKMKRLPGDEEALTLASQIYKVKKGYGGNGV